LCVIFLVEQAGRLSAVSGHTVTGAIRERFGFNYFFLLFIVLSAVTLLVLSAELGGVCVALEMATGIPFQRWSIPIALVVWLLIWKGTFGIIEKGVSILGLVTISFIVGAVVMRPNWRSVLAGAVPSLPASDKSHYWFSAVSILGASISPYLYLFYSSGAIEDEWDEGHIGINRVIACFGMSFGSLISVAVLILGALVFPPRGLHADHYSQLALLLQDAFGHWGFVLFLLSLGISCLGAALEITLQMAYFAAQGFGWNWSENLPPRKEARFSLTYTIVVLLAMLLVLTGIDPLQMTIISMALTAATLPLSTVPFLILMNDRRYLEDFRNGWFSNAVVLVIITMAFVLAIVSIPLQIFGGS
jgi:Mn2+/Fe2+ NRAMP family transporter